MRIIFVPFVVLLAILSGCGGGEPHTRAATITPAISVQSVSVRSQDWPNSYEATGTIRARTAAVLSSKVMAYVRQVSVQVGDRVREGPGARTAPRVSRASSE